MPRRFGKPVSRDFGRAPDTSPRWRANRLPQTPCRLPRRSGLGPRSTRSERWTTPRVFKQFGIAPPGHDRAQKAQWSLALAGFTGNWLTEASRHEIGRAHV